MNRMISNVLAQLGRTLDSRGRIVTPECPPMTGTSTNFMSSSLSSVMKVLLRTTSRVVTPMSFAGSNLSAALRTSAAIGTVELTGLVMMLINADGECSATALTRLATIPAHLAVAAPKKICHRRWAAVVNQGTDVTLYCVPRKTGDSHLRWC